MSDTATNKKLEILVVEDEWLVAHDIAGIVKDIGFLVLGPVPSVEMAMLLLRNHLPDIAFLDEDLRGKPVTQVAEFLQSLGVPFIVISGHARSPFGVTILQDALRLQKPARPSQLDAVLSKLQMDLATNR